MGATRDFEMLKEIRIQAPSASGHQRMREHQPFAEPATSPTLCDVEASQTEFRIQFADAMSRENIRGRRGIEALG
jgi:hypothetical protein